MRIRLLNVLLLAVLVLAVSRLWHFLGEPPPALPALKTTSTPPATTATKAGKQTDVTEIRPESFDVIVARDLFSPTRGVVAPAPAPTAASTPAPKPQPPPKLTLFGVVIVDDEKSAYLQEGNQGGLPKKVRENENFAGGVVNAIRPDGITFLFAGVEIPVPLRTPKAGGGSPASGNDPAAGGPRPVAPAMPMTLPRRPMPAGIQPGQMPVPGRPGMAAPGMPAPSFPMEPGGEMLDDQEFPEGSMPGGAPPGIPYEEEGN